MGPFHPLPVSSTIRLGKESSRIRIQSEIPNFVYSLQHPTHPLWPTLSQGKAFWSRTLENSVQVQRRWLDGSRAIGIENPGSNPPGESFYTRPALSLP